MNMSLKSDKSGSFSSLSESSSSSSSSSSSGSKNIHSSIQEINLSFDFAVDLPSEDDIPAVASTTKITLQSALDKGLDIKPIVLSNLNKKLWVYDIKVTNFTTDWNDGRALSGLIDRSIPGFFSRFMNSKPVKRVKKCLDVGLEYLNIPKTISVPEFMSPKVKIGFMFVYLTPFLEPRLDDIRLPLTILDKPSIVKPAVQPQVVNDERKERSKKSSSSSTSSSTSSSSSKKSTRSTNTSHHGIMIADVVEVVDVEDVSITEVDVMPEIDIFVGEVAVVEEAPPMQPAVIPHSSDESSSEHTPSKGKIPFFSFFKDKLFGSKPKKEKKAKPVEEYVVLNSSEPVVEKVDEMPDLVISEEHVEQVHEVPPLPSVELSTRNHDRSSDVTDFFADDDVTLEDDEIRPVWLVSCVLFIVAAFIAKQIC